jgi:hypothetical protein
VHCQISTHPTALGLSFLGLAKSVPTLFLIFILFIFLVLGMEQGPHLLGKCSTSMPHPSLFFIILTPYTSQSLCCCAPFSSFPAIVNVSLLRKKMPAL